MKIFKGSFLLWLFTIVFLACTRDGNDPSPSPNPNPSPTPVSKPYTNPVFKPILADPSVIKNATDGYYYAYGTEDFWATDNRNHIVAIVRSKDLINWTYLNDAFTSKPTWKANGGGIWAPDVVKVNSSYYMYYSYSTWGDLNPGIGVASAPSPSGPFVDMGKVFLSSDVDIRNCIDPFYIEEGDKKYLFWGSYYNNGSQTRWGTWGGELNYNGTALKDVNNIFKIAASDFEGVMIHKRGNYYYFFGSKGGCCAGANSTYHLMVARSTSLNGPYLDKTGADIALSTGKGSLVLDKNSKFVGPGHCSRIFTDAGGQDWILYHAMDIANAQINGISQRALMMDKVNWDADGWPIVHDGTPSVATMMGPKL